MIHSFAVEAGAQKSNPTIGNSSTCLHYQAISLRGGECMVRLSLYGHGDGF
jgi:hypothetical protein